MQEMASWLNIHVSGRYLLGLPVWRQVLGRSLLSRIMNRLESSCCAEMKVRTCVTIFGVKFVQEERQDGAVFGNFQCVTVKAYYRILSGLEPLVGHVCVL